MEDNKGFWERMARLYTPIQERSNRRLYEQVAACCRPYVTGAQRVLELACGSGQLTEPLHREAAYWEATDFSEAMCRETARRCPGVRTCVRDATALPYGDGSFQVVLMANALHIMPRPEQALAEIRRVLTIGGMFLVPTFVYEGKIDRLRMWLTTKLGFRTYHRWTLQELEQVLEAAGFQMVEAKLLPGSPLPEGFAAARRI